MATAGFEPLRALPNAARWCVLLVISVTLIALFRWARLPAALLLGAMIGGIVIESLGGRVAVPRLPYSLAQAVIGCMVARFITAEIARDFLHQWPLFLGVVTAVILASSYLGFLISKFQILPETTAVWGLLPGAASVMMLLAEDFGADMRLVAFMQYLRAVLVAIAASVIGRFWAHVSEGPPPTVWFPEIYWLAFSGSLGLVLLGVILGHRSRIPAGTLLLPMALGAGLHGAGLIELQLPPWFLAMAYLLLGWNIGLRFTREILFHAFRALPQTISAITVLIAFCGLLAWVLVRVSGIDPLTAYLATSPGGLDSVAIIAASSKVDAPFVMAQQTVRFIFVLIIGPPLSRWVAGMLKRKAGLPDADSP